MDSFKLREGRSSDFARIERLYPVAFPEEELRPLVRALLQDTPNVLSLVAVADSALIGHVVFTPCRVAGGSDAVALLGPLAVATDWQKRGVGSALIRAGLNRLRSAGFDQVLVLGDPNYYGRFGFEREHSVAPPFPSPSRLPLPQDWGAAWQSITLRSSAPRLRGRLIVPGAWNEPALWGP